MSASATPLLRATTSQCGAALLVCRNLTPLLLRHSRSLS